MDFPDRIKTVIKINNFTNGSFAERIGVQRSGVSHILNGRNKPSVEFLLKVLEEFPRVDAGWLLTGKSPSTSSKNEDESPPLPDKPEPSPASSGLSDELPEADVEKIVVFYSDKTFREYFPK
jgi:transcriptional regulator with XRE-family HTH domain